MKATDRRVGGSAGVRLAPVIALLLAVTGSELAAQYPTTPPPPAELRPLQFPEFGQRRLGNGLELIVVENHRLPIVSISLNLQAGSRHDPTGLEGLAAIVAELLTKGTETRTADQIAEEIESVGASLTAIAGNDFLAISSTVLTDHVELAFGLIGDVLLNATFPESELELLRTRVLSGLQAEKSDPAMVATRFFAKELYGDHPYGRRETEMSVTAITRGDVESFAGTHVVPGGGLLVIAGDISADRAARLAETHLGSWEGSAPQAEYPAPPAPKETEIVLVHRPGSVQSNIRIGNLALRPGADLYYPALVANNVLGAGFEGRLLSILREEKGWTYSVGSFIRRSKDIGYFQAGTDVRTEVTDSSLVEMLHQLRRIRSEELTETELANTKGYLVGRFPLTIQTPQQVASQVATVRLQGLGEDYLQTYRDRISAVDAPSALHAAREVIHPDSAVIVVVGDGQAIYDQLMAIAAVRIIDPDGNPLTPDDLAPKAVVLAFDRDQIVARRDSFQVSVQGNPMGQMVSEVLTDGDSLVYRQQLAIPMAGMSQELTAILDPETLMALTVDQVGQAGGQAIEMHLVYDGGRVSGSATTPRGDIQVDTTVVEGTIDGSTLQFVVPLLPLAEGNSFTLNTFDPTSGGTTPLAVKVTGIEEITVPAGTFSAFRIELSGGQQSFVFFVSREAPRRLVKLELVGQPVAFELVK